MNLRTRFFMAVNRQDHITVPSLTEGETEQLRVYGVNEPYVSTDKGDFFVKWWDEQGQVPIEWFNKVAESGFKTILVYDMFMPPEATEEELDFIVRDGGYAISEDQSINIYYRVY